MIDVSVVIVNYNSFDLLDNCINSILRYTKNIGLEIIVIDNDSTEGDIQPITSKYPKIILLKNNINVGFAAANNQGIQIATGEYILFLNNDTLFIEDSVSKILDYINRTGHNKIVGCKLLNDDGTIQASILDRDTVFNSFGENFFLYKLLRLNRKLNRWYLNNIKINEPVEVDIIKGAFMFCPRRILEKLKGFDERFYFYAEEVDFCLRASQYGYKIYYLPQTKIIHFGGYSTDKNLWFKYKNQSIARIKIFQKHYSGIEFYILVFFHYCGLGLRVFLYFLRGLVTLNLDYILKSWYYTRQMFIYPTNSFIKSNSIR